MLTTIDKQKKISLTISGFGDNVKYHITYTSLLASEITTVFQELFEFLNTEKLYVLNSFFFGKKDKQDLLFSNIEKNLKNGFPVNWIDGTGERKTDLEGYYLIATKNKKVKYLYQNQKCVCSYYEDKDGTYAYFGNIVNTVNTQNRNDQAENAFNTIKFLLNQVDMKMTNIIRTWFYNDKILSWYDIFNQVRTKFYLEAKIFDNLLPASTGIGCNLVNNHALIVSVHAIKPKNNNIIIREVSSPYQNEATCYGSSFSRAVEIKSSTLHQLTISGTASIDDKGDTVHIANFKNQLDQTIKAVTGIMDDCGFTYSDIVRNFVYIKNSEDVNIFNVLSTKYPIFERPFVLSNTTICRDNLLIEMEIDAIKEN